MQPQLAETSDRFLPPRRSPDAAVEPYDRLRTLADRFVDGVETWACRHEDVVRLSTLATDLIRLVDAAPHVCFGMGGRLAPASPSMRHALHCAIVGIQLGRAARLEAQRVLAIAKAALTMNLSVLELQDDLAAEWATPGFGQRVTLRRHPQLSAELLASSPGADLRWIETVEQHHEALDGSGYPYGLCGDEISPEARVLRLADTWCALIAPRPNREAKSPREAVHCLLARDRQRLDPTLIDALRQMTGHYPPGTLVRLASREIALVTAWPNGNAPPRQVIALVGAHNTLLRDPVRRDTSKPAYAVRSYSFLPPIEIRPVHWNRVWAIPV